MSVRPKRVWMIPIDDESSAELREGGGKLELQLFVAGRSTYFRAADLRRFGQAIVDAVDQYETHHYVPKGSAAVQPEPAAKPDILGRVRRGEPVRYGSPDRYAIFDLCEIKPDEIGYSVGFRIRGRIVDTHSESWWIDMWMPDGRYGIHSPSDSPLNLYPWEVGTVLNAGEGGCQCQGGR